MFETTTENLHRSERLSAPERMEKMRGVMQAWSEEVNAVFAEALGSESARAGDIVDASCQIDMRAFMTKRGGPYAKTGKGTDEGTGGSISVAEDEALVHTQMCAHSGAREPHAARVYGTTDENAIIAQWKAQQEMRDGALAESAVVALINKHLGEQFVAVHASQYDDYLGGVDTLILDKETGGVICAFDELVGEDDSERHAKKVARAQKALKNKGGMRVRYGLQFAQGDNGAQKLLRTALPHVPGFCVSMTHEELHNLIDRSNLYPHKVSSAEEDAVLAHIAQALRRQHDAVAVMLAPEQTTHMEALLTALEQKI